MRCPALFVSALLASVLLLSAPTSQAGTLRVAETHAEKGDAEQFARIREFAWDANISICLDSPSGSFRAAVAIVNEMAYPTIVPPGAKCIGACAIVFAGGREIAGQGVIHEYGKRTLLPGGVLAFHQPTAEAGADSFADALAIAAELSRLNRRVTAGYGGDQPVLSDPLLRIVLETPAETPFTVSRIGDLVMNEIGFPAMREPRPFGMRELRNVCAAHLMKRYATADGWGYVNDTPDADYYRTYESLFEDGIGSMPELVGAVLPFRDDRGRNGFLGILSGFGLSDAAGGTMVTRQRMCLAMFYPEAEITHLTLSVAITQAEDMPEAVKAAGIDIQYSAFTEEQAQKLAAAIAVNLKDPAADHLRSVDLERADPISLLDFPLELEAIQNDVDLDAWRAENRQYQRGIKSIAEALQ